MTKVAKAALPILLGVTLLILVTSTAAYASVPEIDPTNGMDAIVLLVGAALVLRGRLGR